MLWPVGKESSLAIDESKRLKAAGLQQSKSVRSDAGWVDWQPACWRKVVLCPQNGLGVVAM